MISIMEPLPFFGSNSFDVESSFFFLSYHNFFFLLFMVSVVRGLCAPCPRPSPHFPCGDEESEEGNGGRKEGIDGKGDDKVDVRRDIILPLLL